MLPMHDFTEETERLARAIEAYARDRIALPQPLDRTVSVEELDALAGQTISPDGIGWEEALRLWADVLAPATISDLAGGACFNDARVEVRRGRQTTSA